MTMELSPPASTELASASAMGVFSRPRAETGLMSWITSVDHKKIGIMYGAGALFFFLVGGFEALLIRSQLARPGSKMLSAAVFNQVYTMHGVTMVFLVIMPMAAAFANYLLPLQIGARDVAFPRLNAFSFWCWLFGAIFLNSSWILGGGADGGWFNYAPNNSVVFSPSHGIDFYAVGLQIAGIASLVSAVNLIVTVINMRAPGMTWMRLPVFSWMTLVVQFMLLFSIPIISIALFLLTFDRLFGSTFFVASAGGDPLLWQHLFWLFGHPEVYILILPAFGIVSEVIPVFSRKPIFGYKFMVGSGIAIAFLGFGVWAHHMFASGMGPLAVAVFSFSTMFIAVPTGVKILNWLATMAAGRLQFTTSMLFAMGLVGLFTIGGVSGVSHSVAVADTQQTDTYYIVGHFHYVLFGGALMGLMAGFYFWWPKVFGYALSERLGKAHFWLFVVGMNLTFGPMHVLGLEGMSRRIPTYQSGQGFDFWNMMSTVGAFTLAVGVIAFLVNIAKSYRGYKRDPKPMSGDPWDARSLEWMIPSPTPVHNFDVIPTIDDFDHFWNLKYGHDEDGRAVKIAEAEEVSQKGDAENVHLPSPSYWPVVVSFGMPLIGYGVIFNLVFALIGGLFVVAGMIGWALEPPDDPDVGGHHDDNGDGGPGALEAPAPDEVDDGSSSTRGGEIEAPDEAAVAVGAGAEASAAEEVPQ